MLKLLRTRVFFNNFNFNIFSVIHTKHSYLSTCEFTNPFRVPKPTYISFNTLLATANFSSSKRVYNTCWKCDINVNAGEFFCSECNTIQRPPETPDFYQLFRINVEFKINDVELSRSFRKIQMILHPDKFSFELPEERSIAEEYSTLVNKAYSTLRHPWSRGVYLLKRAGIDFNEETSVEDPALLLKVMERNEAVADALDLSILNAIDVENKKDVRQVIEEISQAFQGKNFELAKKALVKLRYFTNIGDKIAEMKLKYGASE